MQLFTVHKILSLSNMLYIHIENDMVNILMIVNTFLLLVLIDLYESDVTYLLPTNNMYNVYYKSILNI